MERSLLYRAVAYTLLVVAAVVVLTPSVAGWLGKDDKLPAVFEKYVAKKAKILLGLDLQGGLHLVYEVQVDKAVSDKADRVAADLEERLRKDKHVTAVRFEREGPGVILVAFQNPSDASKLDKEFIRGERGHFFEESRDPQKGIVRIKIEDSYVDDLRKYAMAQSKETIGNRANRLGVAEPSVFVKGQNIIIELPGAHPSDFERIKNMIGRTAQLEFKMVDDGSPYMEKLATVFDLKKSEFSGITVGHDSWTAKTDGTPHHDTFLQSKDRKELERFLAWVPKDQQPPSDHEFGFELSSRHSEEPSSTPRWRTYYLKKRAELTGEYLTDAEANWDQQTNEPEVSIILDRTGADLFERLSGANVGRKMAIILDDKINSAPTFNERIPGGHARITMGGGAYADPTKIFDEAKDLCGILRSGSLPAPLKKAYEMQIGPTLGRDAVDKAKSAMVVGTIIVVLFMLLYYRLSGFIADVAMVVNILLQLAILALAHATLTLPGIAGVVLTVGMAVDANIIVYERIREELRAGRTPRGAVEAGFGRAFWTVFDAHITALVACIVLY